MQEYFIHFGSYFNAGLNKLLIDVIPSKIKKWDCTGRGSNPRGESTPEDIIIPKNFGTFLKSSPLDLSGTCALHMAGFEPARLTPIELESTSLDHSDTYAVLNSRIELLTSAFLGMILLICVYLGCIRTALYQLS